MNDNTSLTTSPVAPDATPDAEDSSKDLVTTIFNAWHDLRTAATAEVVEFEAFKENLEREYQARTDIVTVRNARFNQLLFLLERVKLNLESQAAGKPALFPEIDSDPYQLLNEASEWLESDPSFAPEDLMAQLKEAQIAQQAQIDAAAEAGTASITG